MKAFNCWWFLTALMFAEDIEEGIMVCLWWIKSNKFWIKEASQPSRWLNDIMAEVNSICVLSIMAKTWKLQILIALGTLRLWLSDMKQHHIWVQSGKWPGEHHTENRNSLMSFQFHKLIDRLIFSDSDDHWDGIACVSAVKLPANKNRLVRSWIKH